MQNSKATRSTYDRLLICAVLLATGMGAPPLHAQGPAPAPPAPAPAPPAAAATPAPAVIVGNSQDNFQGDRVTFPVNMQVLVDPGDGTEPKKRCLKAGTKLRGIGKQDSTVNFVVISCNPWLGLLPDNEPPEQCPVMCDGDGKLDTGSTIQIALPEVEKHLPNRYGLAYGTLVVPFKFQLTGAHQFTGSATLGPYLGYRFDTESYGLATTLAAFGGVSNIAVTKNNSTSQIAGFGYGGGVLVEVKGGFQAGAVIGFDSVGSNQGFQYNNKPWLAVELGYSFSQ